VATDKTKRILTNYLRKLTNLSGRNRAIFLPRLSSDQFLDVQQLSQFNGQKAFSIIEALIARREKMICPVLDARMSAGNEASNRLKKLQRLDHFIFEERGSRELHVGWPFVRGKFTDGTLVRCPLLFFPVELAIKNEQWVIRLREDSEIMFNKSFLLAYAFYNQVSVSEELLDETFDTADADSTFFRTQLYQMLQKASMAIHFNPDNYRDELISFLSFRKEEFEEAHENGALKLFPEAVLGLFSQTGSFIVPDYLQLLEEDSFTDLEEFFKARSPIDTSLDKTTLQSVREEKVHAIFPMDSWQERALKSTKLGYSLVIQGPPGTGKSQLICNLISDAMAQGKRILVVCQKRAALDVVFDRLKEKGLSEFLALVHDHKTDRNEIYKQLARQIERVDEYKSKNISLDAITLDRQFAQIGKRIDQIAEELEEFKSALFDTSECGISCKELYLQSNPSQPFVNLRQELIHLKWNEAEEFIRKLKVYCFYARQFEISEYPWRVRKSFAVWQTSDRHELLSYLDEIPTYFDKLKKDFSTHFNTELDWEQCETLIEKRLDAITIKELISSEERFLAFQKMSVESDEETSSLWLANSERVILDCFDEDGIELSIPLAQLGVLQQALSRSMKARRSLIGLIRWELFSKDKYLVKRALVGNQLPSTTEGFKKLERLLDRRLNLEHNLSKLRTKSWLQVPAEGFSKTSVANWFADQQSAIKAKTVFNSIRGIKNLILPTSFARNEFIQRIDILFQLVAPLPARKENWLKYVLPSMISELTKSKELAQILKRTLMRDFDALVEFDLLKGNCSEIEKIVIGKLSSLIPSWDEEQSISLFRNSISLAWIEYLESKHPQLKITSSGKIQLLENELKELIHRKENCCHEILLLRARERVTEDLEFNRLNNRLTYRDLLHQVTKKRQVWPPRKVLAEFEEDIFRLLPCWLASPESVSALFQMRELFDLVIFDEASQCYSERGIPALFRGKQVVIAGDSQQLKPGDFYQTRWQEEGEEPETEVDSLLELASRYLASVQLQGHYRSQSHELIQFSNIHFYGGKLHMLPDFDLANQHKSAINYVKVEGWWENNCNEVEAQKVAELVVQLKSTHPEKQIGVITFNAPQQELILDLLEKQLGHGQLPDSLFVKNIENVQGDERDIIIFSIGYAANQRGVVAAQFGSLNVSGGENRLNVAVSRAREKIIVVTSIWPHQLAVEETKNAGPKLLKAYLQFALDCSNRTSQPLREVVNTKSKYLTQAVQKWGREGEWVLESANFSHHDLMVHKGKDFAGIILTDDSNYHQSLSAKASHAYVPMILEKKKWPFIQLYSRNYWLDRDRFFNGVKKFLS